MSNSITLTTINTSVDLPVIYRNTSCELKITLTNETGGEITLQQNDSTLDIEIPGITAAEIAAATITLDKWTTQIDDKYIQLTYTGEGGAKWLNNEQLIISISNLKTVAQPAEGNIQVNLSGFTPKQKPSQLFTPIVISNPAEPGNAKLKDVLQLSLDNGGTIYISSEPGSNSGIQKLENELLLNIKNTGTVPLYTGTKKINPKIEVTFIYGKTTGCLTPASEKEGGRYAWDILASGNYSWDAEQPSRTGEPCPKWVFTPKSTNSELIGTGTDANANVTFSFTQIVAATPVGHTQVLLHFSGFWKDDNTAYDDALFVLDIVKQEPPKERGIINFYSETPNLVVSSSKEKIKFTLKWTAYHVDKVDILIHSPVVRYWSVTYPNHHLPLLKDQMNIELNGISQDTVYLITIQSYNISGTFLNSRQFAIIVTASFFTDSRDGKTYPVINVNNQQWMTEDLKYETTQGSLPVEKRVPDRVYNWEAAQSKEQLKGWRLPTLKDWENLIAAYNGNAYDQLIKGGRSGFNAVLNGIYLRANDNIYFNENGYYWTSEAEGTEAACAAFDSTNKIVSAKKGITQEKEYYLSVRYVRDLDNIE